MGNKTHDRRCERKWLLIIPTLLPSKISRPYEWVARGWLVSPFVGDNLYITSINFNIHSYDLFTSLWDFFLVSKSGSLWMTDTADVSWVLVFIMIVDNCFKVGENSTAFCKRWKSMAKMSKNWHSFYYQWPNWYFCLFFDIISIVLTNFQDVSFAQ